MQNSDYLTPKLGRRSVVIVALCCALVHFLVTKYHNVDGAWGQPWWAIDAAMFAKGCCYGLGLGLCWIATVNINPFVRFILRILLVPLVAVELRQLGTEDWLFNLSNIGGWLIAQSLWFSMLRVSDWQLVGGRSKLGHAESNADTSRQFGIGDVVIATTSIALLLAVVIRYGPKIDSSAYWLVLLFVWAVGPLIAAAFATAALAYQSRETIALLCIGLLLLAGATAGLSVADYTLGGLEKPVSEGKATFQGILARYGSILVGCSVMFVMVAIAGRMQSNSLQSTESTPLELDS